MAILPRAPVGPLAQHRVTTEVVIANSDPTPAACEVALLFHRGTSPAPAVPFNGRPADQNLQKLQRRFPPPDGQIALSESQPRLLWSTILSRPRAFPQG